MSKSLSKRNEGGDANGLRNLLPVACLIASLTLEESDQEWLKGKYNNMADILKETPAYHWMTDDARQEGIKEGLEQGRQQANQAAQEAMLEKLRGKIVAVVAEHFSKIARFAKRQISDVEDTDRLLDLLVSLSRVNEATEVTRLLLDLDEESASA